MMYKQNLLLVAASMLMVLLGANSAWSQEKKDPTAESEIIEKTMSKIREVEKLDVYIQLNKKLTETNKQLQSQLASINKQVAKLTKDLADQQAKLRKQLLQMPSFEVKAKILGNGRDMALLKMKNKERPILITLDTPVSLQVSDGVYLLMEVKKISKKIIELHFPELERNLYLYD